MEDTPQPPQQAPASVSEINQWAMFVHLSLYCGFIIPLAGLIVPIVLWQMKKDIWPLIDQHGKNVVNWIISVVIYSIVCFILTFVVIGAFGFIALAIVALIFPLIGGLKANNGELWSYPLSLKILK